MKFENMKDQLISDLCIIIEYPLSLQEKSRAIAAKSFIDLLECSEDIYAVYDYITEGYNGLSIKDETRIKKFFELVQSTRKRIDITQVTLGDSA